VTFDSPEHLRAELALRGKAHIRSRKQSAPLTVLNVKKAQTILDLPTHVTALIGREKEVTQIHNADFSRWLARWYWQNAARPRGRLTARWFFLRDLLCRSSACGIGLFGVTQGSRQVLVAEPLADSDRLTVSLFSSVAWV
jgi:hypothetical protein